MSFSDVPLDQVRVGQVIVFDWYDGPRSGVVRFAVPSGEFAFGLLDERPCEDDVDDIIRDSWDGLDFSQTGDWFERLVPRCKARSMK